MVAKNPILDYSWEQDTWNTSTPKRVWVDNREKRTHKTGEPCGFIQDTYLFVQAEESDIITVNSKGSKRAYHAHMYIWLNTVDTYINQYCQLVQLHEAKQDVLKMTEYTLPETILEKYKNQVKERIKSRKDLDVDTAYLVHVGNNAKDEGYVDGEQYCTPRLIAGLYLNRFCRNLSTHANAVKKRLSLQFDGLKYRTEVGIDFIPNFSLLEYYWHELATGIALSIEIAAILLEVEKKLPDKDMWKKAFDDFCKMALPQIVKSDMLFTRNSVARCFFQQIYLEQVICTYEWNGKGKYNWQLEDCWKEELTRAISHSEILRTLPKQPVVPDDQIEDSMAHLWDLLSAMETPVNLAKYIEKPTHGLAVFCNPNHEYVSHFLEELHHLSTGSETRVLKPKERKKFEMVHKAVKEAMQRNN